MIPLFKAGHIPDGRRFACGGDEASGRCGEPSGEAQAERLYLLKAMSACGTRQCSVAAHATCAAIAWGALLVAISADAATAQDLYGPAAPVELRAENARQLDPPSAIPDALGDTARKAVRTYPAIRAAEATIQSSAADLRAAKWMRFPSVSVGARLHHGRLGRARDAARTPGAAQAAMVPTGVPACSRPP